ncbi:MAG TPA: PepSY domain-containing protein [Cerasibacillus sp.]|uniref:PepSY domain-containing protein n=1 Tax=Cerasibacillus sp. TaxID=2498711 RepID=UPI002F40E149
MNKKMMITVSAAVIALILGVGIYQSNASQDEPKLSSDDIKALVTEQYPGEITELELEKENNKVVYEVEVKTNDKEYDLKLDGNTGEVLKLKEKCMTTRTDKPKNESVKQKQKEINKAKPQQQQPKQQQKRERKRTIIDHSEAADIALKEFPGEVESIELDEDDGQLIYEVEVKNGHQEADIEIDACTGEILLIDLDD